MINKKCMKIEVSPRTLNFDMEIAKQNALRMKEIIIEKFELNSQVAG